MKVVRLARHIRKLSIYIDLLKNAQRQDLIDPMTDVPTSESGDHLMPVVRYRHPDSTEAQVDVDRQARGSTASSANAVAN